LPAGPLRNRPSADGNSQKLSSTPGGNDRTCQLDIDYYDWEGNARRRTDEANATWLMKRLRLSFGFLAHIELSAPDLVNRAQDIDQAEIGYRLSSFHGRYAAFKRNCPHGSYPLFEDGSDVLSVRFSTRNYEENSCGFLWLVGCKVQLEWLPAPPHAGQIHVPISEA
jgi:hypothetical protein